MANKYQWLAQRLEQMLPGLIGRGIHKLPTEAELSARYHVSRQTVRAALELLTERGLITRRQGSGSYLTGRLAGSQGDVIGILISSDQEYLYPGLLHDIRGVLSAGGFSSQVYVTGGLVASEREILLALLKNPPRGLIAEGCKSALPNPSLDLYRRLMKKGCPVVFLHNCYPALSGSLCVRDDNYGGSALLVKHLADRGHTAIGGIFKADDMQGVERYQGYAETLLECGLPLSDRSVCWYGSRELELLTAENDTGFLKDFLKGPLSACTAVVCYNDFLAYYLVGELLAAGYELPADMAVAAFDNTYLSDSDLLAVTTLAHRPHEMGRAAAETLLKKLSGLPAVSQEIRWTLHPRESTQADR